MGTPFLVFVCYSPVTERRLKTVPPFPSYFSALKSLRPYSNPTLFKTFATHVRRKQDRQPLSATNAER
jgi:hypothetical protein